MLSLMKFQVKHDAMLFQNTDILLQVFGALPLITIAGEHFFSLQRLFAWNLMAVLESLQLDGLFFFTHLCH